jgi:hypothetical protein
MSISEIWPFRRNAILPRIFSYNLYERDRFVAQSARPLAPLGFGIQMPPYHYFGGFTPFWYQRVLPRHTLRIEQCMANGGFFKLYGQESRRFLTMVTPRSKLGRLLFLPFKLVLAIWFRLLLPLVCHWLDPLDGDRQFTAGYFVLVIREPSSATEPHAAKLR